jgi:glycosyltransferase involved in cell wall biosynthesis
MHADSIDTRHAAEVVIPTHNDRPAWLVAAVRSALACPAARRVIVVDDGSFVPVDPAALAEACALDDPSRLIVLHQANRGVSEARNAGMDCVESDWIILLDADDELLPGVSASVLGAAGTGAVFAVAARENFYPDGRVSLKPPPPEWADRAVNDPAGVFRPHVLFSTPGTVVRTAAFRAGLRFDPAFRCYADRDFYRRAADLGPYFVSTVPASRYRQHPDGSNMSGHRQLDARVDEHARLLACYHTPQTDQHLRGMTSHIVAMYARHGRDSRRWQSLTAMCDARGWSIGLKPRARWAARSAARAIMPAASPTRSALRASA